MGSQLQRGPQALSYDQGWRVEQHIRFVRDVNSDGLADLVGLGDAGLFVGEGQGTSFAEPVLALTDLGNGQGWNQTNSVRTLADVNADGRLDIVAFGPDAVMVALGASSAGSGDGGGSDGGNGEECDPPPLPGGGETSAVPGDCPVSLSATTKGVTAAATSTISYGTPTPWSTDYSFAAGWRVATHAFLMGDVDADGRADIVGIDDWGVYVARARSTGGFEPKKLWLRDFSQTMSWDPTKHLRLLADINADGRADLVGFGEAGVHVALSTGAEFAAAARLSSAFGHAQGWRLTSHVRSLANANGDRYPDIIGLGPSGAVVALGGASGFGAATSWLNEFNDATGWLADRHPRFVGDVDGDGLDDVVGIKDDRVFLARSTGGAFSPLESVLDDFTFAKGWRVEKHPRALADVDGDGQLDLVGFFDDAVYWDRLTPESPPLPTAWDAPTCSPSRLAPPGPRRCEGPWRYTEVNRCVSKDFSCLQSCSDYKACEKWENGVSRDPSAGSRAETTSIVGTGIAHCIKTCTANGCAEPSCSGSITQPTVACTQAATTRASDLKNGMAVIITAEQSFDSATAQSQRILQAQALVSVTLSYHKLVSNHTFEETGFNGTTFERWDEQWTCNLAVVTAKPTSTDNEACGCDTFSQSTCEHDCGTSTAYTAPEGKRPSSPYISDQVCMTYDDLPATSPQEIQHKFEQLWIAHQGTPPTTVPAGTFTNALVRRLKLMYELWGEQLVNHNLETDQLHRAISLYKTHPEVNPTCVPDVDAPPPRGECTSPAVTTRRHDLIRCQRLVGSHASEGVASLAVDKCAELLSGYLTLADVPVTDAQCDGAHLRQVSARALLQLEDKQLGTIGSAPTSLGALPRQLWLLDRWYDVSKRADDLGTFSTPDEQRRDTSYLLGRLWDNLRRRSGVDAALAGLSNSSTTDEAEAALGLTAAGARAEEQSVVTAMFTDGGSIQPEGFTLTRPPLRGLPLLALLGDALEPLVDDLDGLAVYHDIACQFRDCRMPATNTPSRNAWKILAGLEASPGLRNAVDANPHALVGWKAVFGALANRQDQLTQAVADAVSAPGGLAAAASESDVHPLARRLWLLYQHARSFHGHYEATGLFESSAQDVLQSSVLQKDQQRVTIELRDRVSRLQIAIGEFKNGLLSAVRATIEVMNDGAQLQHLTDQRLRKAQEMDQKSESLEGLRAAGEDEAADFGSLVTSFMDVQRALDQGAHVQVGDTQTFSLTGADARYTSSRDPAEVAVRTFADLTAGQILSVQTSGAWAPTCALRDVSFLEPDGLEVLGADLSRAVIGPEGYTVTWNGSTFEAHSSGHAKSRNTTVGVSFKMCVTGGFLAEAVGISAEACVHGDQNEQRSQSWSTSGGDERRSTASFATGLRLDNTPFPEAPAGSLLVVLTDPQTGNVRDVSVVHGNGTSIIIEQPSTAHFVVNDRSCATSNSTHALTVSVRPLTSATAVAQAALDAMVEVLSHLRAQQDSLAAQGTLLPNQATLLRQQAAGMLQNRLDEVDVAALPGPLASLFEAFMTHEIVATERRIEIRAIEQSLDLDLIDMGTIDDELLAGGARARLQRLVPHWLLRDLDHESLRDRMVDLLSVSRDFLKPILDLWYPHALEGHSIDNAINGMVNADVDTSLVVLADSAKRFVDVLLDAYEDATFGSKPSGAQLPVVVVSFPRPGQNQQNSFWRKVDDARARRVWDAINAKQVAHFEIIPDDFYSQLGGDAVLPCVEVVPVIKTMGVHISRPGAGDNETLNGINRAFAGFGSATQSFVTPDGPRLYQLGNAIWQQFMVPIRYGESETAVTTFLSGSQQTRPLGLSPAGTFDIDFAVLNELTGPSGLGANDDVVATEIVLVLELDSRQVETAPSWFDRCRPPGR